MGREKALLDKARKRFKGSVMLANCRLDAEI
jgi:hypothetical protein